MLYYKLKLSERPYILFRDLAIQLCLCPLYLYHSVSRLGFNNGGPEGCFHDQNTEAHDESSHLSRAVCKALLTYTFHATLCSGFILVIKLDIFSRGFRSLMSCIQEEPMFPRYVMRLHVRVGLGSLLM